VPADRLPELVKHAIDTRQLISYEKTDPRVPASEEISNPFKPNSNYINYALPQPPSFIPPAIPFFANDPTFLDPHSFHSVPSSWSGSSAGNFSATYVSSYSSSIYSSSSSGYGFGNLSLNSDGSIELPPIEVNGVSSKTQLDITSPTNSNSNSNSNSNFGNDFGDSNLPGGGNNVSVSSGDSATSTFASDLVNSASDAASALGNMLGSPNFSAGFVQNGFMIGSNWGNQSGVANMPGQGGYNPYYGGGSEGGLGFNSLADLGQWAQGLVSSVEGFFANVGSFFSNVFSGIGNFFSSIFPVALDLNGDGVQLTPATSSNAYFDMAGDGYQHLTAWTAPGDAILAYDANNDGKIDQQNEIVFTQWDPTATSDMQALRDVFDTNHDGKLDANDANFSQFKLLVTNADGTQTVETLAQAGVASIGLVEDQTTRTFADGSSIDGQTTFTRTDGTTGTAASVSLAYDPSGAALRATTTHNADGSTTIDNKALNADGSVASERILTTSADGKTRTLSIDLAGDGVIDQIQTAVTIVNADGSKTETVTDKTAGGAVLDRRATTTSADGKTITIQTDPDGGGAWTQVETIAVAADGSRTDTVSHFNVDGSLIDKTAVTISADGLTNRTQTDANGDGVYDLTTNDAIVVNADGSRTETISETNADGSLRDRLVKTASADGLTKTTAVDLDGNGTTDLTATEVVVKNADGSYTTTTTAYNGEGSLRNQSKTTLSADNLTKTTQTDVNGDGVYDLTTTDVTTVNADGSRTQTVTDVNADGSKRDQIVTAKGADGRSRTIQIDQNGDGIWDSVETIVVAGDGSSVDTTTSYAANGAVIGKSIISTSADGLTRTSQIDANGDGTIDRTRTETTVKNADGSSTVTTTDKASNGALIDKSIVTTSANGLTVSTQLDLDGNGTTDRTIADATVVAADGSRTETITQTNNNGSLHAKSVAATSADHKTVTTTTDANGDGATDVVESVAIAANGVKTDTVSHYNPNGSLRDKTVSTIDAAGLSRAVKSDANGDGVWDTTVTDTTALNADGSQTETISTANANGSLRSKVVTTTTATGLSVTTQADVNGDGVTDLTTTDVTALNADGSTRETVTELNANGTTRDQTVTTTSDDGLTITTSADLDGNGAIDRTRTDVTTLLANGGQVETVTDKNGDGSLRDTLSIAVSADGRSTTITSDLNGDGHTDSVETIVVGADGASTDTTTDYNPDGSKRDQSVVTTSANGLTVKTQSDANGDGVWDTTRTDATVLNADGSTRETVTDLNANGSTRDKTVTTTSANGLSKTIQTDVNGDGTFETTATDSVTLNADGSTTETYSETTGNGTLRGKSVTTTSTDGKTISITRDVNGDGKTDQTETIAIQATGDAIDTLSDVSTTGALQSKRVTTTSANGLSRTVTYDKDGNGTVDRTETDVTVINSDGSRTETYTDYNGTTGASILEQIVKTISASGLTVTTARTGANGYDTLNSYASDTTVLNADGSTTETVSVSATQGGALKTKEVTTTSANGLAKTVQTDVNGDGRFDVTDASVTSLDGSQVETLTYLNMDGTLRQKDVLTTSRDGLTQSLQRDTNGDAVFDHFESKTRNADGSTTDVVWDTTAAGALTSKTTTTTSDDQLSTTVASDTNGDGVTDLSQTRTTVLNADGSRTTTLSDYGAAGSLRDRTVTTVSADGLTKTSKIDTNGRGTALETQNDVTRPEVDGSQTHTVSDVYADGTFKDQTITTTSANGLTTTIATKNFGALNDLTDTTTVAPDGAKTETLSLSYASSGLSTTVVTTTSADGLIVTSHETGTAVGWISLPPYNGVPTIGLGNKSVDVTSTKVYAPDSNGSYAWYVSSPDSYAISLLGLNSGYLGAYASHSIDANGIDNWVWNETPTSTFSLNGYTFSTYNGGGAKSISIDVASERKFEAMAERMYDTLLNRDMTESEKQFLADYITVSGSGAEFNLKGLASAIMSKTYMPMPVALVIGNAPPSTEFSGKYGSLTDAEFVERMFQNALGRYATLSELNNYLSQLKAGTTTRADIAVSVSESSEHVADGNVHDTTNNTLSGGQLVSLDHTVDKQVATDILGQVYYAALGRALTGAELASQLPRILNGSATDVQIASELIASSEFKTKYGTTTTNAAFVNLVFTNVYGRAPTAAESTTWTGMLAAGTISRADFLDTVARASDHGALGAGVNAPPIDVTTTTATVNTASTPVIFENGSGGTVASSGNQITLKSNTTVTVNGSNDPVAVTGTGNKLTVSSGNVSVDASAGATVTGSSNKIATDINATLSINGKDNVVNAAGGSTVNVAGGALVTVVTSWVYVPYVGLVPGSYGTENHGNTVNINGGNVNVAANDVDTINGSNNNITPLGSSTLTTNGTNDNFVFHSGFGKDVISGFDSTDTLQFDHAIFADWAHLLAASSQSGADTVIRFDANNTVTLTNVSLSSLTQSQAQFV
jgi:trimeric autotransporter adhesin